MSLVLLLLSILPSDHVVRESVDLMEVNHFYGDDCQPVFTQVIFYDWQDDVRLAEITETDEHYSRPGFRGSRYMVRAWRLIKSPNQVPIRDWEGGGYTALWQDGEVLRKVHSPAIRETWTQFDVELVEREYLPKERRKELLSAKIRP
jgi:hypothetical protein